MRIFFPLLFFFLTLPCFGQSKKELCRQVLASAKTFKDIAPVYNIIAREKDIFKYVPTAKPIKGKYRLSSNFGNRFHPIRRKNIFSFRTGYGCAVCHDSTQYSFRDGNICRDYKRLWEKGCCGTSIWFCYLLRTSYIYLCQSWKKG